MDKSIGTDENGVIVTDGLVLREITLNENDRLLTVLTGEHGRMTVLARGVKNLTSKRAYGLTPFSYSTFEFEKKGEKLRFHDSNVKKSFFDINDSVEGFALASYICEAAGECAMENNDESELLRLCLNMLFSVENKLKPVHILKAVFELKAACVLGFMPDTEYSISSGAPLPKGEKRYAFNLEEGGFAPESEFENLGEELANCIIVPGSVCNAVHHVVTSDQKKMLAFSIDDAAVASFASLCEKYFLAKTEKHFKTLKYYRQTVGEA
mgnify:FL=1